MSFFEVVCVVIWYRGEISKSASIIFCLRSLNYYGKGDCTTLGCVCGLFFLGALVGVKEAESE